MNLQKATQKSGQNLGFLVAFSKGWCCWCWLRKVVDFLSCCTGSRIANPSILGTESKMLSAVAGSGASYSREERMESEELQSSRLLPLFPIAGLLYSAVVVVFFGYLPRFLFAELDDAGATC